MENICAGSEGKSSIERRDSGIEKQKSRTGTNLAVVLGYGHVERFSIENPNIVSASARSLALAERRKPQRTCTSHPSTPPSEGTSSDPPR